MISIECFNDILPEFLKKNYLQVATVTERVIESKDVRWNFHGSYTRCKFWPFGVLNVPIFFLWSNISRSFYIDGTCPPQSVILFNIIIIIEVVFLVWCEGSGCFIFLPDRPNLIILTILRDHFSYRGVNNVQMLTEASLWKLSQCVDQSSVWVWTVTFILFILLGGGSIIKTKLNKASPSVSDILHNLSIIYFYFLGVIILVVQVMFKFANSSFCSLP